MNCQSHWQISSKKFWILRQKCVLKNRNSSLFVLNVICFLCSSVLILTQQFFLFQEINVGSRCSGLGNYIFFNWRAPASFQSLSEVSALVFIFSKEIVCEQDHLWVPRVSGQVRVIEWGVWCWSASKISFDLWSLFPRVSLSPRTQE